MRGPALYGLLRLALRLGWAGLRHRVRPHTIAERLAALPRRGWPLAAPVDIWWDGHLIPFVAAQNDRDLAVALGVVHAHLRLAQIELFRRLAQGRLSELVGAAALPIDHGLRLLDPGRAVPEILAGLPPTSREWLDGFVDGINHVAVAKPPPLEFRLLGITPGPFSSSDLLAMARLAAADVNWILWSQLLRQPLGPDWPETWRHMLAAAAPSVDVDGGSQVLAEIVRGTGRAGSNAFAASGRLSRTGAPWLAGDPHLSLTLPSIWLAAACRSPSYNVVGLMIPGIPVFAVGRNRTIAWGGSNLFAASSELFDVSGLSASEICERRASIAVRWSTPQEIVFRESPYGPLISDVPFFAGAGRQVALRWVGHRPSDELSALLAVARAGALNEFRQALAGFAVPGQTFVCAEAAGNVARMATAHLPRRPLTPPADFVSLIPAAAAWESFATAVDLSAEIDPARGFVVSANERPPPSRVPIGWVFAPRDRAERLAELISARAPLDLDAIADILRDVAAPALLPLRDRLLAAVPPDHAWLRDALSRWDGRYETDSAGALAFELVLAKTVEALAPKRKRTLSGIAWRSRALLEQDIAAASPKRLSEAVASAARRAAPVFADLRDWGGAHRLRLWHPFGRVPVLGRHYRFADVASPGSRETILKAAHGPVRGRHAVGYGSNARYAFDLSDANGNYLVLLGGQDGMLGSDGFLDQLQLFRHGDFVRVPLDADAAARDFPHRTVLRPSGG